MRHVYQVEIKRTAHITADNPEDALEDARLLVKNPDLWEFKIIRSQTAKEETETMKTGELSQPAQRALHGFAGYTRALFDPIAEEWKYQSIKEKRAVLDVLIRQGVLGEVIVAHMKWYADRPHTTQQVGRALATILGGKRALNRIYAKSKEQP